ncbi:MAG: LytTR family DNA-binding domain-containing protein, partial [Bacteroidetes bacterium]|nr:LytTR family DNA-binding domain-containing protein [Bacteroidota bacterium]
SEERATYLQTKEGKKFLIDFPLDKVEEIVDPKSFFRINRKYMISFDSIKEMLSHSNSRLRLTLHHSKDTDVIVSRERVSEFKMWLDR